MRFPSSAESTTCDHGGKNKELSSDELCRNVDTALNVANGSHQNTVNGGHVLATLCELYAATNFNAGTERRHHGKHIRSCHAQKMRKR